MTLTTAGAGEASPASVLALLTVAGERFTATVRGLSDTDVAAPSLLPGWTRGHVLAHVARGGDGLTRLLSWAADGVERPHYTSRAARDGDIDLGAERPAAEHLADVTAVGLRLRRTAGKVPDWTFPVTWSGGRRVPVHDVALGRLREVEIHHLDLDVGHSAEEWPDGLAEHVLGVAPR